MPAHFSVRIGPQAETEPAGLTIAEENALDGATLPSISGAGNTSNVGFAREFSTQAGGTVEFSCHGSSVQALDIYRVGWYGGDGARLVASVENSATSQPASATIPDSNGAITCTGWTVTAEWTVPEDATSGLHVAVLVDSGGDPLSYVPFVVRRDDRAADIMLVTSETTYGGAYNSYRTPGDVWGKSLYSTYDGSGQPAWDLANRALAFSYHRPITSRTSHPPTYWLSCEAPLIRWLERNGYDLSYSACRDWGDYPGTPAAGLASCGIYLSQGHDEYWDQGRHDAWVSLRDEGRHLVFMSGNEHFWRIRFDQSDPTIVWCHKDTKDGPGGHDGGAALDPVSWTGTWRDTRSANDATRSAENLLTGTFWRMNGINDAQLQAVGVDTDHPMFRGTTPQNVNYVIGFEADETAPTAPEGSYTISAARSFAINGLYVDDNGEADALNGTLNWGIVHQRAASGALVTGFGTCQWAWGLDASHDRQSDVSNTFMRQATVNLLTDLGAVAATPQSGLSVPSPASLDDYGAIPA